MTQFNFPTPDRHLEDKSRLEFHFNIDEEPRYLVKHLNFMENIQIDEKVVSNYAQYTPIGSNGSTFAYLGTKSREFDISFNMTLPHIMESTLIKPEITNPTLSKPELQGSFFTSLAVFAIQQHPNFPNKYRKFIREVDRRHQDLLTERDVSIDNNPAFSNHPSPLGLQREDALTKVMFWINLIRSSCLTSSRKPYLGPPIVRIHHGILFSDIPCIVNSYNITYDQMHGFDTKTMLPRVISVKLNLKEVRLRGKPFSPGEDGDYMPGWDSFIHEEFVTLDPNIPQWGGTI